MPFLRRSAAAPDPNTSPLFDRQNVVRALVGSTLSAGALACILLAPHYFVACAIIGLWVNAFATSMNITLVKPSIVVPTVTLVSQERIAAATAQSTPQTTITTKSANPVVIVDPPTKSSLVTD